ncbi:GFA family protein [Phenylobacterium sp.]|uniref:GFA family protein n=1 Tax=Phenylobacterium sp. TaxID=1871053 RepID=UPI00301E0F6C
MITGGCQCGAVRFRVDGDLGEASICHCRMCQKATGGLFGPYVGVEVGELIWTRGVRKRFQSSNKVWRGFCEACGTPLTWEHAGGLTSVMIGALDDPAAARLTVQLGSPSRLACVDDISGLPVHEPTEPRAAAHLASIVSLQHPDRDT